MNNMKMLFFASFVVYCFGISSVYSDTDQKIAHFNHANQILEEIYPTFANTPLFLSKDKEFKNQLKEKVFNAISILEGDLPELEDKVNYYYLLGVAYSMAHDLDVPQAWEKSVEYLSKTLKSRPDHVMARMILAKNYMDSRMYDEAFEEYKVADAVEPNGTALRLMATLKLQQNQPTEAIPLLRRYVEHNPQDQQMKRLLEDLEQGRNSYHAQWTPMKS